MGTNSCGMFLAKSFAKSPNVEFALICYPKFLAKIIAENEKMMGKKPQDFADVRKTLNTCCYNYKQHYFLNFSLLNTFIRQVKIRKSCFGC